MCHSKSAKVYYTWSLCMNYEYDLGPSYGNPVYQLSHLQM